MKRSKFSENQIIGILTAVEAGRTVRDVCREHEISENTYYTWKKKYGGMRASDIRRLHELWGDQFIDINHSRIAMERLLRYCWSWRMADRNIC